MSTYQGLDEDVSHESSHHTHLKPSSTPVVKIEGFEEAVQPLCQEGPVVVDGAIVLDLRSRVKRVMVIRLEFTGTIDLPAKNSETREPREHVMTYPFEICDILVHQTPRPHQPGQADGAACVYLDGFSELQEESRFFALHASFRLHWRWTWVLGSVGDARGRRCRNGYRWQVSDRVNSGTGDVNQRDTCTGYVSERGGGNGGVIQRDGVLPLIICSLLFVPCSGLLAPSFQGIVELLIFDCTELLPYNWYLYENSWISGHKIRNSIKTYHHDAWAQA